MLQKLFYRKLILLIILVLLSGCISKEICPDISFAPIKPPKENDTALLDYGLLMKLKWKF